MTSSDFKNVLRDFELRPPATRDELELLERTAGIRLPKDYSEFLLFSNGGVGMVASDAYLHLWRVGELIELNAAYQVEEFAPGVFLIGSNGGGEAICFDASSGSDAVYFIPFVGMERCYLQLVGENFKEFILGFGVTDEIE